MARHVVRERRGLPLGGVYEHFLRRAFAMTSEQVTRWQPTGEKHPAELGVFDVCCLKEITYDLHGFVGTTPTPPEASP